MRALLSSRCSLPLLAMTLFIGWASLGSADPPPDADSLKAEEEYGRRSSRIRIGGGEIEFDDGSVITIDRDAIRVSVEEALRQAEEAIEEIEDIKSDYRVVRRSDKVRLGKDIHIARYELINGDVVAVGGGVTVEGKVAGDVVAVFGDVRLENTAVVNGEAISVFGQLVEKPGSHVRGQTVSVGPQVICERLWEDECLPPFMLKRGWLSLFSLAMMGILVVVALLVSLIFRESIGRVNTAIRGDILKSWLYGLLAEIILFVVSLILVITIVGIPLVILLWLLVGLACLWAFAGISLRVGEAVSGDSAGSRSRSGHVFIGAVIVLLVPAIARILSIIGGVFWGPALGIRVLGSLVAWFALTTGLGAVVMTRFGTREYGRKEQKAGTPTPGPQAEPPAGPEVQQA